jgi:hypothetical protein
MSVESTIIDYYGPQLAPFGPVHREFPDVEDTTAMFLENIGLPKTITDGTELQIETTGSLSRRTFSKRTHPNLYVFGSSHFDSFAIAPTSGQVLLIDDDENLHFINSHVKYLLLFCILYNKIHIQRPYEVESDAIYRKRAREIREEFYKFDKKAAQKSVAWLEKLEEVRNGII